MAFMLASTTGATNHRIHPFVASSRPSPKRLAVRCSSSPASHEIARRSVLASIAGGIALASTPQAASAEGACSNFTSSVSSGIQWCETKEGTGPSPTKGQLIRCHYTGRLDNGRVFDSSYDRRRPLTFKVGAREVIQGWDQSILGNDDVPPMKEGGKRRVIIPPELAYGSRGAGGVIPPNATLTFDIELLGKR